MNIKKNKKLNLIDYIPEKDIRKSCEDWLNLYRWLWWPMPIGPVLRGKGKIWCQNPLKGFPDDCGILKPLPGFKPLPIFWAVEFKCKKGKSSPEQLIWHKILRENGVHVLECRNTKEFIDWLESLQREYYKK